MRHVKIAHITTIDVSLRSLLLNQLLSIQQAGYQVVSISSPGAHVSVIEAAGIRHIPVPMTRNLTPLADLLSLFRLYRVMHQERFDIVHTHNPKPGLLGQLAARMAGVPIVVNTLHGFYFHDYMHPLWRRFYISMEKIAAHCSDLILSQNQEDIQTALKEGICHPEKIEYLGNGIDLTRFDPDRISHAAVQRKRAEVGLPKEAQVVGFVGRLTARRKGFLDFLAAGRQVVQRLPNIRFLIVGDADYGKPDAAQPAAAKNYGIEDHCLFLGRRPNEELPALYTLMDVLVLPSLFEGLPRAVMEASAMRVPAVATDVKGNREAIEHGRNGLLVPLGDVQSLSNAIVELLTDREKARCMGEEGHRMALERFDEQLVFEKVKSEYTRLLVEKGLPEARFGGPEAALSLAWKGQRSMYRAFGKRLLDLALAIPALILLSPVLALLALLVRLRLGSPVLFRQQRPGLHGQPFTMLKFRTMTDARDAQGNLLPNKDRLTPFGQLLRSTSLDELPELILVLKGDMSLVGPRPLLMRYLERYTPEQMRRHEAKPGITGWAQVNGRNAISWEEKFLMDVWYVDHQSLWLDLKIIPKTIWKIIEREGISQQGYTTAPEFMGIQYEHT